MCEPGMDKYSGEVEDLFKRFERTGRESGLQQAAEYVMDVAKTGWALGRDEEAGMLRRMAGHLSHESEKVKEEPI